MAELPGAGQGRRTRARKQVPWTREALSTLTASIADLLAPDAVDIARDHLRLDGLYARTLILTSYPARVSFGWLGPLLAANEILDVSLHLRPQDARQAQRILSRTMVQLQSSRLAGSQAGRLENVETEVAYGHCEDLRDRLQRGDDRVLTAGLYITLYGTTPEELEARTVRVETLVGTLMGQTRRATWQALPGSAEHPAGWTRCPARPAQRTHAGYQHAGHHVPLRQLQPAHGRRRALWPEHGEQLAGRRRRLLPVSVQLQPVRGGHQRRRQELHGQAAGAAYAAAGRADAGDRPRRRVCAPGRRAGRPGAPPLGRLAAPHQSPGPAAIRRPPAGDKTRRTRKMRTRTRTTRRRRRAGARDILAAHRATLHGLFDILLAGEGQRLSPGRRKP